MAIILDGKATAKRLNEQTGERVQQLVANGTQPGIAVILVGDDPASEIYTRNKQRKAESLGMKSLLKKFPTEVTQDTLLNEINHLNADPSIHAILVQAPLPDHIDGTTVTNAIVPEKDVDGFNPVNLGKLYANQAGHYPVACTPKGIMTVLAQYDIDVAGKDVVVVGRSILVGRPVAALLVNANATVTLASRHTKDLNRLTKAADIVVVAIGNPNFIKGENLKAGAVVIDVGINRLDNGKLVGDVDFASAEGVVSAITPVPGGVGPMTIATLMQQTVELAEWSSSDGK